MYEAHSLLFYEVKELVKAGVYEFPLGDVLLGIVKYILDTRVSCGDSLFSDYVRGKFVEHGINIVNAVRIESMVLKLVIQSMDSVFDQLDKNKADNLGELLSYNIDYNETSREVVFEFDYADKHQSTSQADAFTFEYYPQLFNQSVDNGPGI